jgi:hypothetical protein
VKIEIQHYDDVVTVEDVAELHLNLSDDQGLALSAKAAPELDLLVVD